MARTTGGLVAARTRTAAQILTAAELLALYEAKGGLKRDLEIIRDAGQRAEEQALLQSIAKGEGSGATIDVVRAFAAVQRDYSEVMSVVQAVRSDLVGKAPAPLSAGLDQILTNEAHLVIRTVEKDDGTKARRAARSRSQEAVRAEIAKDAGALLALTGAEAALAKRKVDGARLAKLKADADALSGKLADRAVKKGAGHAATEARTEAASEQSAKWSACYRLLGLVGQQDQRVAQLLIEAARPSKKKA